MRTLVNTLHGILESCFDSGAFIFSLIAATVEEQQFCEEKDVFTSLPVTSILR